MKKKLTITIASILSVIVIIGVGFAAWVITNPNVKAESDGTISVETVTDKSYTLTAKIAENDKTIVFGKPANATTEGKWFTFDSSTKEEKLEATLTLTLNYNNLDDVGEITFKMETLKDSAADNTFESLVTGKYIVNPTISYKGNAETYTAITAEGKTVFDGLTIPKEAFKKTTAPAGSVMGEATATIKITFGWGDHFKVEQTNVNPFDFYNAKTYTDGHNDAVESLTKLAKLNDVSYKVTVTGTTAA